MPYCRITYCFHRWTSTTTRSLVALIVLYRTMTIVISIINKPIYYSFRCMRRLFLFHVACLFITLLLVLIDDITKWHRLPAFISRLEGVISTLIPILGEHHHQIRIYIHTHQANQPFHTRTYE